MLALMASLSGLVLAGIVFIIQELRRRASERDTRQFRSRFEELQVRKRTEAWELWRSAEYLWRKVERLKERLDQKTVTQQPIVEKITRSQISAEVGTVYGLAFSLAGRTILHVKAAEPDFGLNKISEWRTAGKIANDFQEQLFRKLTT